MPCKGHETGWNKSDVEFVSTGVAQAVISKVVEYVCVTMIWHLSILPNLMPKP